MSLVQRYALRGLRNFSTQRSAIPSPLRIPELQSPWTTVRARVAPAPARAYSTLYEQPRRSKWRYFVGATALVGLLYSSYRLYDNRQGQKALARLIAQYPEHVQKHISLLFEYFQAERPALVVKEFCAAADAIGTETHGMCNYMFMLLSAGNTLAQAYEDMGQEKYAMQLLEKQLQMLDDIIAMLRHHISTTAIDGQGPLPLTTDSLGDITDPVEALHMCLSSGIIIRTMLCMYPHRENVGTNRAEELLDEAMAIMKSDFIGTPAMNEFVSPETQMILYYEHGGLKASIGKHMDGIDSLLMTLSMLSWQDNLSRAEMFTCIVDCLAGLVVEKATDISPLSWGCLRATEVNDKYTSLEFRSSELRELIDSGNPAELAFLALGLSSMATAWIMQEANGFNKPTEEDFDPKAILGRSQLTEGFLWLLLGQVSVAKETLVKGAQNAREALEEDEETAKACDELLYTIAMAEKYPNELEQPEFDGPESNKTE